MEKLTLEDIIKARGLDEEFVKGNHETGRKLDIGFFHNKYVKDLIFPAMGDLSCHFAQESLFENVIFAETDFSGVNFNRSKFTNCIFINCKLVKSEMQAVELTGCTFDNCNLFRTLFTGKINQCIFEGCKLQKMILTETNLTNTIFRGEANPVASNNTEHNVIWDIKS